MTSLSTRIARLERATDSLPMQARLYRLPRKTLKLWALYTMEKQMRDLYFRDTFQTYSELPAVIQSRQAARLEMVAEWRDAGVMSEDCYQHIVNPPCPSMAEYADIRRSIDLVWPLYHSPNYYRLLLPDDSVIALRKSGDSEQREGDEWYQVDPAEIPGFDPHIYRQTYTKIKGSTEIKDRFTHEQTA